MLAAFPDGFEEREVGGVVELAGYTSGSAGFAYLRELGPLEVAVVRPGWEEAWRRFHRPVRIGSLWIGPSWEEPDVGSTAIVIDPGRAFGTGGHPTTRLCLDLLLGLTPASFVDLGCGSGILAVAAARLGFAPVVAVDEDPVAVETTRANAARNGVEVETRRGSVLDDPLPAAEIAVANITRETVERAAERFRGRLLVSSGYLAREERPQLRGWQVHARRTMDGWAVDLFERPDREGGQARSGSTGRRFPHLG
jgi:ribosomal protein L11 methyltransferase